jgi:hypothetical protein
MDVDHKVADPADLPAEMPDEYSHSLVGSSRTASSRIAAAGSFNSARSWLFQ